MALSRLWNNISLLCDIKFYINNSAKLDAWVMGSKMANVGRMSGKDNKIFACNNLITWCL